MCLRGSSGPSFEAKNAVCQKSSRESRASDLGEAAHPNFKPSFGAEIAVIFIQTSGIEPDSALLLCLDPFLWD